MHQRDTPTEPPTADDEDRLARVHRLIDECIERRSGGGDVSHDDLVAAHPDLMPELAEELRHLAVIERARRRASGSSQLEPLAAMPGGPALGADVFPGYDIVGEIHRGGQGVVYRAVQRSTQRIVALKVLREGMFAADRELARFEREVEILAALQHPNIVRVYDRGVTAGGSFYYVMDHVAGLPADGYLRRRWPNQPPPVGDTLGLFLTICGAVHAAHLNGVIHRDIKPSNIRVDDSGRPYVLDFGLAKQTGVASNRQDVTGAMTLTGQFVGSIPWASPEQAAGAADVDLRTDVYTLGLLLYHLLTGEFPYNVDGAAPDTLDRIAHDPAVRPSQYRRDISDELETIILRCLAKDRARRYESAGALALDIHRMIAGEPIDAKRDSPWYVLRKALWRHRVTAGVAVAFFVLVTATAVWLAQLYAAQREQSLRAAAAATDATRQAERADSINKLLLSAIAAADPYEARGKDYSVRELLDDFDATLADQQVTDLEVLANVHLAVAKAYRGLGLMQEAHDHFKISLDLRSEMHREPHRELANSLNEYAISLDDLGSNAVALELHREAHAMFRDLLGEEHPDTIKVQSNIAGSLFDAGRYDEGMQLQAELIDHVRSAPNTDARDLATYLVNLANMKETTGDKQAALALADEALAIIRESVEPPHPLIADFMTSHARIDIGGGRIDEALRMQLDALAMRREFFGENHPEVGRTHTLLAQTAEARGALDEAVDYSRKALAIFRAYYPSPHPTILTELSNLAQIHIRREEIDEAVPFVEEMLAMNRALYGEEHFNVVAGLNTLGQLRVKQGRYAEAETEFTAALDMLRNLFGDKHTAVPVLLNNLGMCRSKQGDNTLAVRYYRAALTLSREVMPEDHPSIGSQIIHLAEALKFSGDHAASMPLYLEALDFQRRVLGPEHIYVGYALNGLGDLYLEMRDFPSAETAYRESLHISTQGLPQRHASRAVPFVNLGRALVELDRPAEAEPYLRRGLEIRRATRRPDDEQVGYAHHWLGACLNRLGRFAEAEPQLAEALRIRQADATASAWSRAHTLAELGQARLGLGHAEDAEVLLLESYAIAEGDEEAHPEIRIGIAKALVHLYEATAQTDMLQCWQARAADQTLED